MRVQRNNFFVLFSLVSYVVGPAYAEMPETVFDLLGVEINGQQEQYVIAVFHDGSQLLLDREDAGTLGLDVTGAPAIERDNKTMVSLAVLPGVKASIDTERQTLMLTVDATGFASHHLALGRQSALPTRPADAAFMNYDLLAQADTSAGAGKSFGGTFELGGSGAFGMVDNTMVAAVGSRPVTRLETSYVADAPEDMNRLLVGDSITRNSAVGSPLRFAGVQFGRNFALQPGFVAYPSPSLQGQAALPSTVEVYVNNALRYRDSLPAGPFSIDRLPTVTGPGETTLVVRDPLGHETVTQGSFYTTPSLLNAGLWDYSYSAGMERQDFGQESFAYKTPFTTTLTRYGFSDAVTGELELDASAPDQIAGGGFSFLIPVLGQAQIGEAVSHESKSSGSMTTVGLSRIGSEISFTVDARHAFGDFMQLGDAPGANLNLWQFDSSVGWSFDRYGSVTAGFTELERRNQHNTNIASLTYGVQLGSAAYVAFSLASIADTHRSNTMSLTLTLPLGGNRTGSTSVENRGGQYTSSVNYAERPDHQRGFGTAVTAGVGKFARDDALATWDDNASSALAEISHTESGSGARGELSGGLALIGDDLYASRKVNQSFGLVSVKDHPDVRVYRDNIEVAKTDADGNALVPNLMPFEENRLRLDITDIPIGSSLQGETLILTPAYRGAVVGSFNVQATTNLSLALHLADDTPVPAGAVVQVAGQGQGTFTGFDGQVFLEGTTAGGDLYALWGEHKCHAILPAPQEIGTDSLGPVMPVLCEEIKP